MSYVMFNFGVFPAISDSYLFSLPVLIGSSNFISGYLNFILGTILRLSWFRDLFVKSLVRHRAVHFNIEPFFVDSNASGSQEVRKSIRGEARITMYL